MANATRLAKTAQPSGHFGRGVLVRQINQHAQPGQPRSLIWITVIAGHPERLDDSLRQVTFLSVIYTDTSESQ